jgi:hypothetical protein
MVSAVQDLIEQRLLSVLGTALAEPGPEVNEERAVLREARQLPMVPSEFKLVRKAEHPALMVVGMNGSESESDE